MPKVIENLREKILARAKVELLKSGYEALTIRGVAQECGIAVGTVYNYFPSKDVLAASIMLEDWMLALQRIRESCAAAESVVDGLTALYNGIAGFYEIYRPVWAGYSFSGSAKSEYGKRRKMLVAQLADCIRPVLLRFSIEPADDMAVFIIENILTCSGNSEMTFDMFLSIAKRIL